MTIVFWSFSALVAEHTIAEPLRGSTHHRFSSQFRNPSDAVINHHLLRYGLIPPPAAVWQPMQRTFTAKMRWWSCSWGALSQVSYDRHIIPSRHTICHRGSGRAPGMPPLLLDPLLPWVKPSLLGVPHSPGGGRGDVILKKRM